MLSIVFVQFVKQSEKKLIENIQLLEEAKKEMELRAFYVLVVTNGLMRKLGILCNGKVDFNLFSFIYK